jgi:hypothetical protein
MQQQKYKFNIFRFDPYFENIIIENNRDNIFESLLVFLLIMFYSLQFDLLMENKKNSSDNINNINDDLNYNNFLFSSSLGGGVEIKIIKEFLFEILNSKDILNVLIETFGMKIFLFSNI